MANVFALEIVTPDKTFYNGNAEMIVVRTTEGDRGILKNHRPLVAGLATGTLRIKLDGKLKKAIMYIKNESTYPDSIDYNQKLDFWE